MVKFTEGAWLVVILFAVGVPALIRLNREYKEEAGVLARISTRPKPPEPPTYARRTVFVFVDEFDLAAVAALRYARSLRPTTLRAVHFVIDNVQADTLRQDWVRANTGVVLDFVDCADRRLARCAAELVSAEADLPGVGVTAILPRRSYTAAARPAAARPHRRPDGRGGEPHPARRGHDRAVRRAQPAAGHPRAAGRPRTEPSATGAADGAKRDGAGRGSRDGGGRAAATAAAAAARTARTWRRDAAAMAGPELAVADAATADADDPGGPQADRPAPPPGVRPLGTLTKPGRATVEGRVYAVEIRPVERNTVLAAEIADSTGQLTALFYGRSHIPGLVCGARVRFRGQVGMRQGGPVMINPAYELVAAGDGGSPPAAPAAGEPGPPPGDPPRRGLRRRKGE